MLLVFLMIFVSTLGELCINVYHVCPKWGKSRFMMSGHGMPIFLELQECVLNHFAKQLSGSEERAFSVLAGCRLMAACEYMLMLLVCGYGMGLETYPCIYI